MTYPATNSNEATQLIIDSGNQIHEVINGGGTETVTTDSGEIPTLRKALVDNFFFLDPLEWSNGQDEISFNQIRIFTDGTFWIAPFATNLNPIPMGATPYGDSNWVITGLTKVPDGYVLLNVTDLQPTTPIPFVTNQFTYQFLGRSVKTTDYYVTSGTGIDSTQLLVPNKDYTFTDLDSDTITLTDSWEGFDIFAKSITVNGSGYSRSPNTFTVTGLTENLSLNSGDEVVIPELGNARYVIRPEGWVLLSGDISLDSGQVAELQSDINGDYSVLWFGATPDPTDTTIQDIYFSEAAERVADYGFVIIPNGRFKLTTPVPTATQWRLAPEAEIIGLGGVAPTFQTDTTYLTGTMIRYSRNAKSTSMYVGETDYAVQKARTRGVSGAVCGVSHTGHAGVVGATSTDKSDTLDQGSVGVSAINMQNNTTVARTGWSLYSEMGVLLGALGNSFAHENAIYNKNPVVQTNPNAQPGYGAGVTAGEWCSVGIGEADDTNVSAWKALLKNGVSKYAKGLVAFDGAVVVGPNYAEMFSFPQNYATVWYPTSGIGYNGQALAWTKAIDDGVGVGKYRIHVKDLTNGTSAEWSTNVGTLTPTTNNTEDIATSSTRVKTIYAQNALDTPSDREKKYDETDLTQNELDCFLAIGRLIKKWKWKDERDKKTDESGVVKEGETIYWHVGPIAQDVWDTMVNYGLNPTKWGIISRDSNGENYSIMKEELNLLISKAQQDKIDEQESRLAALENANG